MKHFVVSATSSAAAALLYTRFLSDAHQPDWGRAMFVGIFVGLISIFFVASNKKIGSERPRKSSKSATARDSDWPGVVAP